MSKELTKTELWMRDHPLDERCPADHSGAIKWRRHRLIGSSYRDLDHMKKATTPEKRARYEAFMKWRATLAERETKTNQEALMNAASVHINRARCEVQATGLSYTDTLTTLICEAVGMVEGLHRYGHGSPSDADIAAVADAVEWLSETCADLVKCYPQSREKRAAEAEAESPSIDPR